MTEHRDWPPDEPDEDVGAVLVGGCGGVVLMMVAAVVFVVVMRACGVEWEAWR